MDLPINKFKDGLANNRPQIGLWSQLRSSIAAEVLGDTGLDWVCIDMEHAPNEVPDVAAQLQGLARSPVTPIVRLPCKDDPTVVKRVLDIGVEGILVPYVNTTEEAKLMVDATRYPPLGIRGVASGCRASRYGKVANYHARAHEQICVVIMIESVQGVEATGEIASIEGVDGLFIGPSDLAADMGLGFGKPDHPELAKAIGTFLSACRGAGKPAGIMAPNVDSARRYLDEGFAFVALGSDLALLSREATRLVAAVR